MFLTTCCTTYIQDITDEQLSCSHQKYYTYSDKDIISWPVLLLPARHLVWHKMPQDGDHRFGKLGDSSASYVQFSSFLLLWG